MSWWRAFIVGALAFWLPVLAVELWHPYDYSVVLANVLPLVCMLLAYSLARRCRPSVRGLAVWMMAGMYVLAPALLSPVARATGGGGILTFAGGSGILWFLAVSLFPPFTLVIVGYNGTIVGVLAATAALTAVALSGPLGPLPAWMRPRGNP